MEETGKHKAGGASEQRQAPVGSHRTGVGVEGQQGEMQMRVWETGGWSTDTGDGDVPQISDPESPVLKAL